MFNIYSRLSKAIKEDIVSLRGEVGAVGKKVTQLHIGQITRTSLFLLKIAAHKIKMTRFVDG